MGKITFILGGARSGKSSYALALAKKSKRVAFLATCEALDKEMEKRIALHKNIRPNHWQTFEEAKNIDTCLKGIGNGFDYIILDCLTLLVSNLILAKRPQIEIENMINRIITQLKNYKAHALIVSNEVGLGIVPQSRLGRDFRDIAGKINQIVAKEADEVIFMISGIPNKIKRRQGG